MAGQQQGSGRHRLLDDDHVTVDCIYSSALEPETFLQLLDNWEVRLRRAGYSAGALSLFDKLVFEKHLARAGDVADRLTPAPRSARSEAAVAGIHAAAMIAAESGEIIAANAAAEAVFAVQAGLNIADLPLDPAGLEQFHDSVARVIGSRDDRQDLLRIASPSSQKQVFILLRSFEDEHGDKHALIVTTEQAWSDEATSNFQRSFGLTPAEIGILRSLLSGGTVTEIAADSGRADATVRSQIHSLLGKTGTRSQAELLRITTALLQATAIGPAAEPSAARHATSRNIFDSLRLPDGRRLDFMRLGDPQGVGFYWLPGNLSQCRLPAPAERALKTLGLAMIVPVKAGWGYSSPLPRKADAIATAMSDLGQLRRHLGLGPGPLVAHGNDFMLATELARRDPAEVTRIIGVSAAFPIESPEDHARLGQWARFFLANARYAPKVLTFLAKGTHGLVRAIGFEAYAELALRGTSDAAAFRDPDIRAAVIAGSEILFGPRVRAYEAFAAEIVAVFRDWRPDFSSLGVPVTLFHGEDDHNCPYELAAEICRRHEGWRLLGFPDTGHLACHVHWRPLLQLIADSFPAHRPE
jgi:pimeloyl-ACP methyl ester carboxylesterase/DNA-binding NarL/FixJ family response regulator